MPPRKRCRTGNAGPHDKNARAITTAFTMADLVGSDSSDHATEMDGMARTAQGRVLHHTTCGRLGHSVNLYADEPGPSFLRAGIASDIPLESDIGSALVPELEPVERMLDAEEGGVLEAISRTRVKTIEQWLPHRNRYLDALIKLDGREETQDLCDSCESMLGQYRCKDCFAATSYCSGCIIQQHRNLPLHRIQKWNGSYWGRFFLHELGCTYHLGHRGRRCPYAFTPSAPLVVLHTNGFHQVNVSFCACEKDTENAFRPNQLLRERWYPASSEVPKTAFTFDFLDCFFSLATQGKTAAHDYYQALVRFTDGSGLGKTPKRYDEFLCASRSYAHLHLLKRAGRGHEMDGIASTKQAGLALDCPSCPHPGKNLPVDWKTVPKELAWLYSLILAIDANFRLKMKDRKVVNDPELGAGLAYMVENASYVKEVAKHKDAIEPSTCDSSHQAIERALSRANSGYLVTGVGAVICARSGIVRGNGVGNLQKGEKYANMDLIFLLCLVGTLVTQITISYDICCQWSKNLRKRTDAYPAHLGSALLHIVLTYVVPKFHLPAHGDSCQTIYSLNYRPGSARTDGEGIERGWSHINPIATSTREMGPGFRHDTLDIHWDAWNWHKITSMGQMLEKRLREAITESEKQKQQLHDFSASFEPNVVLEWTATIKSWEKDPDNNIDPFFEVQPKETLSYLRKELAKEELASLRHCTSGAEESASSMLFQGLEIEEQQRVMRILGTSQKFKEHTLKATTREEKRVLLFRKILKWMTLRSQFMPEAPSLFYDTVLGDTDPSQVPVEDFCLSLPSSLSAEGRTALHPNFRLTEMEGRLRLAQAQDSLANLRSLLRRKKSSYSYKKSSARGVWENTRARNIISQFEEKIKKTAARYRAARAALVVLIPDGDWTQSLKPLNEADIIMPGDDDMTTKYRRKSNKDIRRGPDGVGKGRRTISWIWLTQNEQSGMEGGTMEAEASEVGLDMRAAWSKQYARAHRWGEELLLVQEEMRRTLCYHDWKAAWWRRQSCLRITPSHILNSGLRAYAEKQAMVWEDLAVLFAKKWGPLLAKQKWPTYWPEKYLRYVIATAQKDQVLNS